LEPSATALGMASYGALGHLLDGQFMVVVPNTMERLRHDSGN
jgi:hypothetical protein